jgi:NAD(P)-dependent dehydrogenase (short-subunit alcohol dehydrogenase family)
MNAATLIVDEALEASVIGSFSKIGYDVRSRLDHWPPAPSMVGQRVLITGATSGIGHECAQQLARLGASVHFVARDRSRAETAKEDFLKVSATGDVEYFIADVADLAAIRDVAAWSAERDPVLNVLIHNAGAITKAPTRTSEGFEVTVAAQLLGPYLLTGLLLPSLTQASPGRVISVSSGGMYTARFDLAGLDSTEEYDGVGMYARVKRAQVVLTNEWPHQVNERDVQFFALHPGWVDTPGIRSSLPSFYKVMKRVLRTPAQGADTAVWLAAKGDLENGGVLRNGRFWLDRRPRSEYKTPWTRPKDARGDQRRLWAWCQQRTKWPATVTN